MNNDITAIRETIDSLEGLHSVKGEVTYNFNDGEALGIRQAIGFRIKGASVRTRKVYLDAAVSKLHRNHNGIKISVEYPNMDLGFVYLGWE